MADLNLTFDLSPSAQALSQLSRLDKGFNFKDNFSSPLNNISRNFREFDKSLDASNARVLAFGASAGIILGVERAFSALIRTTIDIEKSFQDINVILGLSNRNLTQFGGQLFDIAKTTGQSFKQVADAAKELSRQGLTAQEVLSRTRDALILTRQSGLDAEDSVRAITTALNSFNKEALTSTTIISKLANVDAQFAVSSADLANALSRVGATAEDAGVGFDQLIGLVTAAQQTTSRGGAVIGNALKSIFTRISRPEVIEQLKELGVQINESQNGVDKLRALADALQEATPAQASIIKELAGGVYQVNILSATLSDLQSKYSIVSRATRESAEATDQAIRRNEKLNETLSTLTNRTLVNFQQVSSQFGKLSIGPALERVLGGLNLLLEGAVSKDSDNLGEIMGRGILRGLGEFLSGPGLVLIGGALVKLIGRLGSEAATAFKTVIGLNEVAKQREALEANISVILARQPDLIKLALTNEQGLLSAVRQVNLELQRRSTLNVASSLIGGRILRRNQGGSVPNFADTSEVPNFAFEKWSLPYGDRFIGRYGNFRVEGSPNTFHSDQFEISSLRKTGKGNDTFEQHIPEFKKDLASIGTNRIGYTPLADDGRMGSRVRLFEKLLKKHGLPSGLFYSSGGQVPNFNALSSAISRESGAVSSSLIRVGASSKLQSSKNPLGLGVYNLRDEPGGLQQGINRAVIEGHNPRNYGIPNFALDPETFKFEFGSFEKERKEFGFLYTQLAEGARQLGGSAKERFKTFEQEAQKLSDRLKPLPETMARIRRSFEGLEIVFNNLNRRPLLTNAQTIAQSGGLYPPSQANIANINKSNIGLQLQRYGQLQIGYTPQPQSYAGTQPNLAGFNPGTITSPQNLAFFKANAQKLQQDAIANFLRQNRGLPQFSSHELVLEKAARNPYYFGTQFPTTKPSLFSRLNQRISDPKFQNNALLASIGLPIAAGAIAESIGTDTRQQRGLGQTAQSLGNVGSYAALGLTFGPAGGVVGAGAGLLLETPRVMKAFTDIVPDLQREIERLTENINQANNGFNSIIQTNEKLAAYQRGEINLTPNQYVNLQQSRSGQISQLATLFPKNAADIYRASNSGNISDIERVLSTIVEEKSRQNISKLLQVQSEKIVSSNFSARGFDKFQNSPYSILSGVGAFKAALNPNTLLGGLNDKNKEALDDFVNTVLSQTAKEGTNQGKSLQQIFVEDYQSRLGKGTQAGSTSAGLLKSINTNDIGGIVSLLSGFQSQGIDVTSLNRLLTQGSADQQREIVNVLQSQLTGRQISQLAAVPAQDPKKIARDQSDLLLSFIKLKNEIDTFVGELEIINSSKLGAIQREFDTNLSRLKTDASIGVLRNEKYSPLSALDIQRQSGLKEIDLKKLSEIQALTTTFRSQEKAIPASLLSKIQEISLERAEGSKNFGAVFPLYNREFSNVSSRLLTRPAPYDFFQNASAAINNNIATQIPRTNTTTRINSQNLLPSITNTGQINQGLLSNGQVIDSTGRVVLPNRKSITNTRQIDQGLLSSILGILPGTANLNQSRNFVKPTGGNLVRELDEQDINTFYDRLTQERDRISKQLSTGESSESRDVLEKLFKQYNEVLTNRTLDLKKFQSQLDTISKEAESATKQLEDSSREKREQIIESLAESYSLLVGDINALRENANKALSDTQSKGLTGRAAIRNTNFEFNKRNLPLVQQDYRAGQKNTQELRQSLTQTAASDIEKTGQLSVQRIGQLFTSNFQYNSRDFFNEVKDDTLELGSLMRSEFSSAFQSFVNGSKSAGDAARQLGISIATNILNKVANIGLNSLVGGLFNAGSGLVNSFGKSRGGIAGYAGGGMVYGGSGMRDDIPLMLNKGSYVIQKSAVSKYGSGFLNTINSGQGYDSGGGVSLILRNQFDITGKKSKTKGDFNVDPRLSVIGQTDENNPQNSIKFRNEQDYISYLGTLQQYKKSLKDFERAQKQRLLGSQINALFTVGGAYLNGLGGTGSLTQSQFNSINSGYGPVSSSYANQIGQYNNSLYSGYSYGNLSGSLLRAGGGAVDNIPALLTGGEYVMSRDAVRRHGASFMNNLNAGRVNSVQRFFEGGLVGTDVNSINSLNENQDSAWRQILTQLTILNKTNENIKDLLSGNNRTNKTNAPNSASVNNNVSINITMGSDGKTTSSNTQSNNSGAGGNSNQDSIKKFANIMRDIALKTIIEESRPGGLLKP